MGWTRSCGLRHAGASNDKLTSTELHCNGLRMPGSPFPLSVTAKQRFKALESHVSSGCFFVDMAAPQSRTGLA
jgi:hypothetical protein